MMVDKEEIIKKVLSGLYKIESSMKDCNSVWEKMKESK